MMKAAGVFAFVAMLVFAGVSEAPAISFNSAGGIGSCAPVACVGGFVDLTPHPSWAPEIVGGGVWVSFANTGVGPGSVSPANVVLPLIPVNATSQLTVPIPVGSTSLTLLVFGDDTAGVRVDGSLSYTLSTTMGALAPNSIQGTTCANGPLSCTANNGAAFSLTFDPTTAHTVTFDFFQRDGGPAGILWTGDLQVAPIPEPATILLVGSALAAAGMASRRRLQKKQD